MLLIDSRENSALAKAIEQKANRMNIQNKKQWLEVGDYVIGDVCFEAKSAMDFLNSVISKRIWTQVDNMDRNYNKNFVVIYGSVEDALGAMKYIKTFKDTNPEAKKNMYRLQFKGAIGRLRLDYDVGVIWRDNVEDAVSEIITLAKMAPVDRKVIMPSIPRRIATNDVRVDMLRTIKGVSESKAKELLKLNGSIMEIGDSKKDELTIAKGIGDIVADRILSVLNSEKKVKQ
tara:strand:- start:8582 stop:9274 length:693 start_codon:yes stop_codon:yes gene_type:complete